MRQKAQGKDLIFISRITRTGRGVTIIDNRYTDIWHLQEETFELNILSITYGTYIASGFNSYVVKIKEK